MRCTVCEVWDRKDVTAFFLRSGVVAVGRRGLIGDVGWRWEGNDSGLLKARTIGSIEETHSSFESSD
jgi:hypothetical protein